MSCDLERVFKKFKGQPVEILTEGGMKICGVDCDSDEDSVDIVDRKGRTVHVAFRHIEAVVEPRMRLDRICGDDDCNCHCDDDDYDGYNGNGNYNGNGRGREKYED